MLGGRAARDPRAIHGLGPARLVRYRFASVAAPVAAHDPAAQAAIVRFEHPAGMASADFAHRYERGDFGRVAWARVWFDLLQ